MSNQHRDKVFVIGSGPAGVSCAFALVRIGLDVAMLDAGIELEPERREVLRNLQSRDPSEWDELSLNTLRQGMSVGVRGIPLKYAYGSDFPFRETDRHIPLESHNVEILPSLAKGGLSNVWGAAVLPYTSTDIADWPISITDLAPHYESVLSFMDFVATKDDLESIFQLYSSKYQSLRPSRQAIALMEDLRQNKNNLNQRGIFFGSSRLAVRALPATDGPGCVYSGLCMYGCPYGVIYNSSSTLTQLQKTENFHYIKDVVVKKLVESKGQVQILAQSRLNGHHLSFDASRVYLACGVLSTTKILMDSWGIYNRPLTMRDSQYFLFPLLRYQKTPDVLQEKLHTLPQVFLEIFDPALSKNTIHLSLYTYNDLYLRAIRCLLGPTASLFKLPLQELMGRLLMVQGYLHSSLSTTISVSLEPGKDEFSPSRLVLEAVQDPIPGRVVQKVSERLLEYRKFLKAVPISPLLKVAKPGRGFHSGGTIPMRSKPSDFESDCLGRPQGFGKVHIVDATVFPSIPATMITLSVMANAHRIASAHHLL